jgi:hypothetical protein
MKTINLDVSEDFAREMLPVLEKKQAALQEQVSIVASEILKIKRGLGIAPPPPSIIYATASMAGGGYIQANGTLIKTPAGRVKKGQSETLICGFLKERNGSGATIKEITAETGTIYGTARRVLEKLKKLRIVNEDGGLWRIGETEYK